MTHKSDAAVGGPMVSDSRLWRRGSISDVASHGTRPCHRWPVMRQALPENQVQKGKEAGSWDPARPSEDQWGRYAGRLYVTCLSIYHLEVYYRHMPLYQDVYSEAAKPGE